MSIAQIVEIDKLNDKIKELEKENKQIDIPFTSEDLEDLMNGQTFDWTFDNIDVHLEKQDDYDEDED